MKCKESAINLLCTLVSWERCSHILAVVDWLQSLSLIHVIRQKASQLGHVPGQ